MGWCFVIRLYQLFGGCLNVGVLFSLLDYVIFRLGVVGYFSSQDFVNPICFKVKFCGAFVTYECFYVILQVECCGVDSYQDFTGASQWITNYPGYTLQTPLSCCKELPSSNDYTCATAGSTNNNKDIVRRQITISKFILSGQFYIVIIKFCFPVILSDFFLFVLNTFYLLYGSNLSYFVL